LGPTTRATRPPRRRSFEGTELVDELREALAQVGVREPISESEETEDWATLGELLCALPRDAPLFVRHPKKNIPPTPQKGEGRRNVAHASEPTRAPLASGASSHNSQRRHPRDAVELAPIAGAAGARRMRH